MFQLNSYSKRGALSGFVVDEEDIIYYWLMKFIKLLVLKVCNILIKRDVIYINDKKCFRFQSLLVRVSAETSLFKIWCLEIPIPEATESTNACINGFRYHQYYIFN